jgi:hypothetical protein
MDDSFGPEIGAVAPNREEARAVLLQEKLSSQVLKTNSEVSKFCNGLTAMLAHTPSHLLPQVETPLRSVNNIVMADSPVSQKTTSLTYLPFSERFKRAFDLFQQATLTKGAQSEKGS